MLAAGEPCCILSITMNLHSHRLDYAIDIPFAPNRGRRCAPACTKMILDYTLPELGITEERAEEMSGFREGYSTWAAQHLLSLDELGFGVGWIQEEDLPAFSTHPTEFMIGQTNGDMDTFNKICKTNDLTRESARIREYLNRGLSLEMREATREDITRLALGGHVVRLEVNGKSLAGQPGDLGHAVLVSGFSDTHIRLENPDGAHGAKPKQLITWSALDEAWDGYHALQHYKPPTATEGVVSS